MADTPRTSDLPEGYRLDLSSDPDAPALRRPDGTVVARFAPGGLTREAIEREVLEDLMTASRGQGVFTREAHSAGPFGRGFSRHGTHLSTHPGE